MIVCNEKPLALISYDTQTCALVKKFIARESDRPIVRISPADFLSNGSNEFQYVNLVVKDWQERIEISTRLAELALDRWTYIGESTVTNFFSAADLKVGKGCILFPSVWAYSGSIGDDVIIHGNVRLAENIKIGNGCYLSGNVSLAGSCTIGDRCYIGNNLFFMDQISICNDVRLLPGTNLRKNIKTPGTYYNPNMFKVESVMV
jgi:acetyltransferase-like isoleucine patch superfamily enzyme